MQGRDTPVSVGEEVQAQATPDRQSTTAAKPMFHAGEPNMTTENDIFTIEDQDSTDQLLRRLAQASKRKRLDSPESAEGGFGPLDRTIKKAKSILDGFTVIAKLAE